MNKEDLLRTLRMDGNEENIVEGFRIVSRENFVLPEFRLESYENRALPIGFSQTISQPSTIAFMLTKLEIKNDQKILEVGSGSGYVLALLHAIVPDAKVFGTERIQGLYERSLKNLSPNSNIKVIYTPNKLGLAELAPFDRILLSASASVIPEELLNQLSDKGIMVCPVLNSIMVVKKMNGKIITEEYPGFVFVPLL